MKINAGGVQGAVSKKPGSHMCVRACVRAYARLVVVLLICQVLAIRNFGKASPEKRSQDHEGRMGRHVGHRGGRVGDHPVLTLAVPVSDAWARGRNRRQQRARLEVLDRDRWRCTLRYPGEWTVRVKRSDGSWGFGMRSCLGTADQAHHTRDRAEVGDDPRYMVAACGPCNRRAGDPSRAVDPPHTRARTQW